MSEARNPHPYADVLESIREKDRWRFLRAWSGAGGVFTHDGRQFLNFSSNDYLDLSNHPSLCDAVAKEVTERGCGATASRLMSGSLTSHERLEVALAQMTGKASALVFPSGYQTNVGVLTALAGRGDAIFSDALNHASIIDGARLSRAAIHVYRHNDPDDLEQKLQESPEKGRRIIVTDSVFSMDGDLARLPELAGLARRFNAVLVVDEAHAIGIWGDGGGLCRHLGVEADVIIGTMGKALGSGGGFVASDPMCRDLFINRARSFIYSTGVSPMNTAAALAAVAEVAAHREWGGALLQRAAAFRQMLRDRGLPVVDGDTQIIPVMVGEDARAVGMAERLLDDGLIVTGIRPPTVPEGTARLRLSVTQAHDEAILERAADALARVWAA